MRVYGVPALSGTNADGYIYRSAWDPIKGDKPPQENLFIKPRTQGADPTTLAHESEHLLAQRGLGDAPAINTKFDELVGDPYARSRFVERAVAAAPYLKKTYGLDSAYFDPRMLELNGGTLLYEQLAELAAIEQAQGKDLTRDPELRKTLFRDRAVRETYNALTGLRQTRLDSKDLPPHTRVPETPESGEGILAKLNRLLGFANGGMVDGAGNTRLI